MKSASLFRRVAQKQVAFGLAWIIVGVTLVATPRWSLGQSSEKQDPALVKILADSLVALGGAKWDNVTSFRASGTETKVDGTTAQVILADDWSNQLQSYREHDNPNGATRKYIQIGNTVYLSSAAQIIPTKLPQQDFMVSLIGYLPAVVIRHVLADSTYEIAPTYERLNVAGSSCLRIEHPGPVHFRIRLCISNSSHLPVAAFVDLDNHLNPNVGVVETLQYLDFNTANGLVTPLHVSVRSPNGNISKLDLTKVEVNPVLNIQSTIGGAR